MPSKYDILVIDDESANLSVISKYLEHRPYSILYAPNGENGYEIAIAEQPDLIILDWAMPILNGIDTMLKLKATEETKCIPIIIATGVMTGSKDLHKALEAGAMDYVRKPYDPLELDARVCSAIMLKNSIEKIRSQGEEIRQLVSKEKQLLKEQLDFKERELSILSLHDQEKGKLLHKIHDKLKVLKKEQKIDSSKVYQELIKIVTGGMQGKNSEEFLYHFQHVHPDFFKHLSARSSQLTAHELKICSYLKLAMRNKEIAEITGTSVGTVKSNVNRIKNKLGLNVDVSLRKYIREMDSKE